MINAVTHMLNNIHSQISPEILEMAFASRKARMSIDEAIIKHIVDGRVRPDVSSVSGQYKEILLDPAWAVSASLAVGSSKNKKRATPPYVVYQIPPEEREHRNIVMVMELSLPFGGGSNTNTMGAISHMRNFSGVSAGTFAEQALNGVTGNMNMINPSPILLASNQVKLTPMELGLYQSYSLLLKCRLEYDRDFTNLTPNAVFKLSELGVCATKAYIYTNLAVKLDQGATLSGQVIGRIRDIIDSYADQNERYEVLRGEFHGQSEVLDINTMRQQMLMGVLI